MRKTGIIYLYRNDNLIESMKYTSTIERRNIMRAWMAMYKTLDSLDLFYFQVSPSANPNRVTYKGENKYGNKLTRA